eukprot:5453608-Pleurochrysis_carterae.AAC.1
MPQDVHCEAGRPVLLNFVHGVDDDLLVERNELGGLPRALDGISTAEGSVNCFGNQACRIHRVASPPQHRRHMLLDFVCPTLDGGGLVHTVAREGC